MVTLTNNQNLPQQIVDACLHNNHKTAGDYSVSQIAESPRVIQLKRNNTYTEDVSERLYMLLGTALHHILELANISEVRRRAFMLVIETLTSELGKIQDEKKKEGMQKVINYLNKVIPYFFPEIQDRFLYELTQRLEVGEKILYGTLDVFDKQLGILYDYKFCSVYQYIYPESRQKWEAQTNVYAYMLEQNGYEVKEIRVVAFFRDWSDPKFNKKKDYPPHQTIEIPIKKRLPSEMSAYITKRIEQHQKAEETGILPFCTGKERWATATEFVVKTPGVKKALRKFATDEECDKFMLDNNHKFDGLYKEKRIGESKKCEKFCSVREFCDQYKAELEERRKLSDTEEENELMNQPE